MQSASGGVVGVSCVASIIVLNIRRLNTNVGFVSLMHILVVGVMQHIQFTLHNIVE